MGGKVAGWKGGSGVSNLIVARGREQGKVEKAVRANLWLN